MDKAPKDKSYEEIVRAAQECVELVIWQGLIPNKDGVVSSVNKIDAVRSKVKDSSNHGHSMSSQAAAEAESAINFIKSQDHSSGWNGHRSRDQTPGRRSTSRNRSASGGRNNRFMSREARYPQRSTNSQSGVAQLQRKPEKRKPSVRFDVECFKCHRKGHFAKECRSGRQRGFRVMASAQMNRHRR